MAKWKQAFQLHYNAKRTGRRRTRNFRTREAALAFAERNKHRPEIKVVRYCEDCGSYDYCSCDEFNE